MMPLDLRDAYGLFHRAIPIFALMSVRGIKVDSSALADLGRDVKAELAKLDEALHSDLTKQYKRKYGQDFDPNSNRHKQMIFFDVMGLNHLRLTKGGEKAAKAGKKLKSDHYAVDAATLDHLLTQVDEISVEADLIYAARDRSHLVKLQGYVTGWQTLMDQDGYLHPSFLLHSVTSYRSSSSDPNFQNIPARDPLLSRIRKCLVPRHDWLVEMDFSGAEVRGYAIHGGEGGLARMVRDGVDMHRTYAEILFGKDSVTSQERYKGKNGFVFPEFYGSYHETIERNYPEWRGRVKDAEDRMWGDMPEVKAWQTGIEKEYLKTGILPYLTGFRARFGNQGFLSRNQICNIPNQGFAFHRLLKVLCDVEDEMRARQMKSIIIGQIHDSVVADVLDDELEAYLDLVGKIVARPAFGFDKLVPWEAEFKIGANMLGMEKV